MIYLDVTGACLLELEAGIPRTTRGLWSLLQREATPVFWQPFRGRYTELSTRSRRLLMGDFFPPRRPPRDSTLPLLWASLRDLGQRAKTVELTKIIGNRDLLLLTSIFPDNRLGYLQKLAKAPGRKAAIFHDAIPLRDPNVVGWERSRHVEGLRTLAQMDLVIAISESAATDLLKLWQENRLAPTKVAILPWPMPFHGSRPPFTEPPLNPERVLCVSRLKHVKNHATLFEACEQLWKQGLRFELDLIGCEDEAAEARAIKRQIEKLKSNGRSINWRPQVSEEELHQAYARAIFTVFPSLMEGFGLPIIESLWHGRPVICAKTGPAAESARDGGCLAIDVRRADVLASAMGNLMQDENRRRVLAEQARARSFRTWDDYGHDLRALLEIA